MTDQEINIAIAVACGWCGPTPPYHLIDAAMAQPEDYCNDLNAMRSAVLSQSEQFQEQFDTALKNSGKRITEMESKEWATIFLQCKCG